MPRRRGLDPNAIERIRDDLNRGFKDTRPAPPEDPEEFVRPSFIASRADEEVYTVGKAEQYYQGPWFSTRVAQHAFVPLDENGNPYERDKFIPSQQYQMSNATYGKTKIPDMEHGPYGLVFVKWQKSGKQGGVTVYGIGTLIPLSVYRIFKDYYSKGRAVVHLLESYDFSNNGTSHPMFSRSGIS